MDDSNKTKAQLIAELRASESKLKKAEEEIKEREIKYKNLFGEAQRFRHALDKVPSYVYIKDLQSHYTYANQLTLDLFNCTADELIGRGDTHFFPSDTVKNLREIDSRVFNGETTDEEIDDIDEKGEGHYYLEVKSPIFAEQNSKKIVGLLGISTDITDRKKAENALRDSKEELSQIYNSVGDALFYIGVEPDDCFRFLSINQMFLTTTGLTEEQVVGKRIEEVIPEPSIFVVLDKYKKAVKEKKIIRWEEVTVFPTGEKVGAVNITPVLNEERTCIRLVGSVHDITDSKKAEDDIISLSKFPSENPNPVLRLDEEGKLLYKNESVDQLLNKNNLSIKQINRIIPPNIKKHIAECLETGEARDFLEVQINTKTYSYSLAPVVDKSYVNLYGRDITERKKAEDELRQYEHIVSSSTDMMAILDKQYYYIAANNSYLKAFNKTKDELVGHTVSELFGEDFFINTIKQKADQCLTDNEINYQAIFDIPDNGQKYLDVTYSPYLDSSNKVVGFVVNARDVTDRKKVEEQIKSSLKEKEVLLREIHHRVKNNMQVISSMLQIQAKLIEDKKYADLFLENSNRILSMAEIHSLLYKSDNFSEINFSKHLSKIVENIVILYKLKSEKVKIQIDTDNINLDIETAIPCGLIVNELVTNSLKYAFNDSRNDKLSIMMKRKRNDLIELSVSDNGVGLPDNYDWENTDTFGLKIVNLLTLQLEGKIKLRKSKGTSFVITFGRSA